MPVITWVTKDVVSTVRVRKVVVISFVRGFAERLRAMKPHVLTRWVSWSIVSWMFLRAHHTPSCSNSGPERFTPLWLTPWWKSFVCRTKSPSRTAMDHGKFFPRMSKSLQCYDARTSRFTSSNPPLLWLCARVTSVIEVPSNSYVL
jgi:hypothetical protein